MGWLSFEKGLKDYFEIIYQTPSWDKKTISLESFKDESVFRKAIYVSILSHYL